MTNSPLIEPDGHLADNLATISSVLRFVEETAQNNGTHLRDREAAYTVQGWAGLGLILGLARSGLDDLATGLVKHDA